MSTGYFNTVILSCTDNLYRFAHAILKEPETAKDAVQDCLAKMWKRRKSLEKIENPQAWAFRIVRNHCLDIIKKSRYTAPIDHALDVQDVQVVDYDLLYKDQLRWLKKILKSLSDKQQQVYHLREIEELSYREISDIMDISMSEVKVSLHRARTTIKSKFEKIEVYGR